MKRALIPRARRVATTTTTTTKTTLSCSPYSTIGIRNRHSISSSSSSNSLIAVTTSHCFRRKQDIVGRDGDRGGSGGGCGCGYGIQGQQRPFATNHNDNRHLSNGQQLDRSVSNPSSTTTTTTTSLLQRTKHLLDPTHKLDATDHALWVEADQVLRAWLSDDEPHQQQNVINVPPLKRVECCLRLLDRLASSLPQDEILFGSLLDTSILHQLLRTWKQGLSLSNGDDNDENNEEEDPSIKRLRRQLTPSLLAQKMDKYRWVSLIQPDVKSFNLLLHATHAFPYRDGVAFADGLLQRLVQVSSSSQGGENNANETTPPLMDAVSIATVMQGWVQHRQPEKAEEWLQRLQDWRRNDNAQSNRSYLGELTPNRIMYTTVLSGWAKVGNASRAQQILQMQLDNFQHGNVEAQPDTRTFNVVLDALAKSSSNHGNDDGEADHHSSSSNDAIAIQAEAIVAQMREYATTLDWDCSPDDHTWTNVLACHVRVKPNAAAKLLKKLEQEGEALSLVTYNTMLHGYAQAGQVKAAMDLLQKLESSSTSVEFQPDVTSYNIVLSALAKSKANDAVLQAEAIWSRMQDIEHAGITPSTISYGALLQCWAKSKEPGAADRAEELLREMARNPHTQPNIVCYNTVLNAWGNQARLMASSSSSSSADHSSSQRAVERVLRLFQELVESKTNNKKSEGNLLEPTDSTFRAVLHAIVGSSVPNKGDLIDSLRPAMELYRFRPSARDEKLLQRISKTRERRKQSV